MIIVIEMADSGKVQGLDVVENNILINLQPNKSSSWSK